jgi:hypothetical protein
VSKSEHCFWQPSNQPTKKITKGGVLSKRSSSSVVRLNYSFLRIINTSLYLLQNIELGEVYMNYLVISMSLSGKEFDKPLQFHYHDSQITNANHFIHEVFPLYVHFVI